jgi:CRISPR-associated protein Cas1
MYRMRFQEPLNESLSLEQIRGREGVRVREAYAQASRYTGVEWKGRRYERSEWSRADPINRALSAANSCLYGVCHAAIISAGYSPALGFIHTGKMLSFVYDIADLYKAEITIPVAFAAVAYGVGNLETRVRYACRNAFHQDRLLDRIIPDINLALGQQHALDKDDRDFDVDDALPGQLWDPIVGHVPGGVNSANGSR